MNSNQQYLFKDFLQSNKSRLWDDNHHAYFCLCILLWGRRFHVSIRMGRKKTIGRVPKIAKSHPSTHGRSTQKASYGMLSTPGALPEAQAASTVCNSLSEKRFPDYFFPKTKYRSYLAPTITLTAAHGPELGPQGQAAGPFVGGEVEHPVQCRAVARPR